MKTNDRLMSDFKFFEVMVKAISGRDSDEVVDAFGTKLA